VKGQENPACRGGGDECVLRGIGGFALRWQDWGKEGEVKRAGVTADGGRDVIVKET